MSSESRKFYNNNREKHVVKKVNKSKKVKNGHCNSQSMNITDSLQFLKQANVGIATDYEPVYQFRGRN